MSETFRDEDWYGDALGAVRHVGATFLDVDLTEATTSGAHFEECVFRSCRFNASTHTSSAFVACTFETTSFFDATSTAAS
jgi:uncharacterized protein YjbI with pentapeptide repeats